MRQGVLSSGNVLKIGWFVPSYLNCGQFPVSVGDFGAICIVRFQCTVTFYLNLVNVNVRNQSVWKTIKHSEDHLSSLQCVLMLSSHFRALIHVTLSMLLVGVSLWLSGSLAVLGGTEHARCISDFVRDVFLRWTRRFLDTGLASSVKVFTRSGM